MAEQPIKSSELYDINIFDALIKGADAVIEKEKQIISVNKDLLASYKNIANAGLGGDSKSLNTQIENNKKAKDSINELNNAEVKLLETEKAKVILQQEEIKLKRLVDAENKKQLRTLNDLNGEYKKGTQDLNRLKKELKELEFTGRNNGKLYKALSNEFNNLDSKVRKAEVSVKEFQRNVGNYPKALDSIGAKLAGAFSIGAVVSFGQKVLETRAEFQKFEAVLTNTLGSNSAAQSVLQRIQDLAAKTPFSVQELTQSFVKLANQGFKPTNEEIIKLGDLAASQGKTFDQLTEGLLDAQTFQFERLKEFGIRSEKSGDKLKFTFKGVQTVVDKNDESVKKYILSLGDLEGVSGGMAAISETLGGKISNLGDNFDTFFNNLGKNTEGVFAVFLDSLNSMLGSVNDGASALIRYKDAMKEVGLEGSATDISLINFSKALNQTTDSSSSNVEKIKELQKAMAFTNEEFADGKINVEDYNAQIKLIGLSLKKLNEVRAADKSAADKAAADKSAAKKAAADKAAAAAKKLAEEKNKAFLDKNAREAEVQNKEAAREERYRNEQKQRQLDASKLSKEIEEDLLKGLEEDEKIADEKKKAKQEKELQDAIDFGQQILDVFAEQQAKKSALIVQGFEKEIADSQSNIDTQRRLAENGRQNTLADAQADKVRIERQKEEEKQQEIKRQKALAFFKLFASYAEKDPNTALQKALRDTVIAETIALSFSKGKFIEGTENVARDLSGNKIHNNEDGYLINVDGRERILNPKQNEMVGNLSNEDLAKLAYDHNNGLLDTAKYGAFQSDSFAKNMQESALLMQTIALRKEIKGVKDAIENRPTTSIEFTKQGDYIESRISKGIEKRVTHKIGKRI